MEAVTVLRDGDRVRRNGLTHRGPDELGAPSSREPSGEPEPEQPPAEESEPAPSQEQDSAPADPRRRVTWIVGAVVGVVVLVIAGFLMFGNGSDRTATTTSSTPTTTLPSAAPAPAPDSLPEPEALTGVLYKIVDPAVPGDQKLVLVEAAGPDYAGKLDQFSKALQDNGFLPVDITAVNVAFAPYPPGNVTADVSMHSQNPALANGFTFPMEFKPTPDGGWQLTRTTANILLDFGQNPATPTPTPTG